MKPALNIEYKRNRQSRSIRISHRGQSNFLVTYPYYVSRKKAEAFVNQKWPWMERIVDTIEPGLTLRSYLHQNPNIYPWHVGQKSLDLFEIEAPGLIDELKGLARESLPFRIKALSKEKEIEITQVQIRDQRTRWGSCSSSGTLSLNWRLILMPFALQNHILLHELAHKVELNHSDAFWGLLSNWDPDCQENRKAIRTIGKTLIHLTLE